jgi:hypothetical protein
VLRFLLFFILFPPWKSLGFLFRYRSDVFRRSEFAILLQQYNAIEHTDVFVVKGKNIYDGIQFTCFIHNLAMTTGAGKWETRLQLLIRSA